MHPPSRARRILKWTGVGLSVVILAAWMISMWCSAELYRPRTWLWFNTGQVCIYWANFDIHLRPPDVLRSKVEWHDWRGLGFGLPYLFNEPDDPRDPSRRSFSVHMPFWLILLLTAIPTAWLWHRDRRRIRPGHCQRCGYDLTGNTSGVCSECGEKAAIAKPPPATL